MQCFPKYLIPVTCHLARDSFDNTDKIDLGFPSSEVIHSNHPQTEVIRSIPDTRPRAHQRKKDTVRRYDPEECGDKVCVESWNDGKGHASQEGVQGCNQR